MTVDTASIIDTDLRQIISNENYFNFPRHFAYPKELIKNALLFVGINPSDSDDSGECDIYSLCENEYVHPYFRKFPEIANKCHMAWTHIDLLFYRETNQKNILNILEHEHGIDFICEQLKLSDKLIRASRPKIIVVCNTQARTFLGKDKHDGKELWLDYNFKPNDDIGTYMWDNVPVFFSGMLTGQRALDIGSYERLIWHINYVKTKLKL